MQVIPTRQNDDIPSLVRSDVGPASSTRQPMRFSAQVLDCI